ncbi:DNA-directed DNA polymerase [Candidatus Magnetobacterium bavaricum]|uniref:DNA-directed DNA polymerase n=1 Tax=Candidatus Magnetobacterium bavaricum TaxID=29290 RepID=A0A0F3GS24_9BACT|nr:DNA-directed DNA polymerase [Candidatus Magnetobacterium bavaricum]
MEVSMNLRGMVIKAIEDGTLNIDEILSSDTRETEDNSLTQDCVITDQYSNNETVGGIVLVQDNGVDQTAEKSVIGSGPHAATPILPDLLSYAPDQVKLINPFKEPHYPVVYDLEVYPNFFLGIFLDRDGLHCFTMNNLEEMLCYVSDINKLLIGFNNASYDDLMLKHLCYGGDRNSYSLFNLSVAIVKRDISYEECVKTLKYKLKPLWGDSFDLMAIKSQPASLKEYAVRIGWHRIQDLPYAFDKILTSEEASAVAEYCLNDVLVTKFLWELAQEDLLLRLDVMTTYGVNTLCKDPMGMSEGVFMRLYSERVGLPQKYIKTQVRSVQIVNIDEIIPANIEFRTPLMVEFLSKLRGIVTMADQFKKAVKEAVGNEKLTIGTGKYSFGVGGLHSLDKPGVFETTNDIRLIDIDVSSCYPSLIINHGLCPRHLNSAWTDIMRELTEQRIEAKRKGLHHRSTALKLVVNGAFGKMNNKYSFMYDAQTHYAVTISVQLYLLMLIEGLVECGIKVLSANTDGILIHLRSDQVSVYDDILNWWKELIRFSIDTQEHRKYARRDVNDYVALQNNGKVKCKGIFLQYDIDKKCDGRIIREALVAYFTKNTPIEKTIKNGEDILKYVFYFKAKDGFELYYNGQKMQKTNRWYISKRGRKLEKRKGEKSINIEAWSKVVLINDLKTLSIPDDLDYDYYIEECRKVVDNIEGSISK